MYMNSNLKIYAKFAKLMPLRGKAAIIKGWTGPKGSQDLSKILNHAAGGGEVGWILGPDHLIIDVDVRGSNNGLESLKSLEATLGCKFKINVTTPSGGCHIYLHIPNGLDLKSKLKDYPNIDFLKQGKYIVISGEGYKQQEDFEVINEAPERLLKVLIRDDEVTNEESQVFVSNTYRKLSIDEVKRKLYQLNPNCDYETWLKCGLAIHNEFQSNSGFILWDEWSKKSDKYKIGETKTKWKSFSVKHPGRPITIATLVNLANNQNNNNNVVSINLPKNIPKTTPDWVYEWIYVTSHDKFYNLKTKQLHSSKSFDLTIGPKLQPNKNGGIPSATILVRQYNDFKIVDKFMYSPTRPPNVSQIEGGMTIMNSYDHDSKVQPAVEYTEEGLQAVDRIVNHINLLFGEDRAQTFIDWSAHQIQQTGVKVPWVPMIQGPQGVGKSFLGALFRAILGFKNVGIVTPNMITSDFNEWMTGRCINILEELKVPGKNRGPAAEALKMPISDPYVMVNEKYITSYLVENCTNYICFTNFKDAIPITNDDRRWWIITIPFADILEFESKVQQPHSDYFDLLFESLEKHPSEISKWLTDHKISNDFKRMKRAPLTNERQLSVNTERAAHPEDELLVEIINEGEGRFNDQVIVVRDLINLYEEANYGSRMSDSQIYLSLKRLGYQSLGRFKLGEGVKESVWAKSQMGRDGVLKAFKST